MINHIKKEDGHKLPEEFFHRLSQFFNYTGRNNPVNKIYTTLRTKDEYAVALFIFSISHLLKVYIFTSGINTKQNLERYDGIPFIMGIHTVVKQFHPNINNIFIQLMSKYVVQLATHTAG